MENEAEILKDYIPEAAIDGFQKALGMIRTGSADGAVRQLKSLISSYGDQKTGEIRSVLCQLEIHTGKFRQALRLADELSGEFPERTYYKVLKAQCLYLLEKNASALKEIRSIANIHDAFENYAIVYNAILNLNGMKSKSIEPFHQALQQWQEQDRQKMEPVDQYFGLIAGCDILGYETDDDLQEHAEEDMNAYLAYLNSIPQPEEKAVHALAGHISTLSETACQKNWSRQLFKKLLDCIEEKGFLTAEPDVMKAARISVEFHDLDEDPQALAALKECLQAFDSIKNHKKAPQYDDHDRFMDKVDQAVYQWIFAELRREHMEEIDYAKATYNAYWNEINSYLREEEEIEEVQEKAENSLVQTTGLSKDQVKADLKDEYEKLIHIDPARLKEESK